MRLRHRSLQADHRPHLLFSAPDQYCPVDQAEEIGPMPGRRTRRRIVVSAPDGLGAAVFEHASKYRLTRMRWISIEWLNGDIDHGELRVVDPIRYVDPPV